MTITKRTTKGSALTYAELDENFRDLDSDMTLDRVLRNGDSSNSNATILGNVTLGDVTMKTLTFSGFEGIGANATHGYTAGGRATTTSWSAAGQRFSFASGTSESIGNTISQARENGAAFGSSTHGYAAGGRYGTPTAVAVDDISKYAFSSSSSETDVGNLSSVRFSIGTGGQQSNTHGYITGGGTGPTGGNALVNIIEKVPFTSDGNAIDVGDLRVVIQLTSKASSSINGYDAGGGIPNVTSSIDKFPFATDANSANTANLSASTAEGGGTSSGLHGYVLGGRTASPGGADRNDIQKFSFSIDIAATDVGDLTQARIGVGGHASSTHGFSSGGGTYPPFTTRDVIDKFPFSVDASATDVGELTGQRYGAMSTQG